VCGGVAADPLLVQDSDGEHLTRTVEKDILSTIHAIRNKDPKIYDPKHQFYHSDGSPHAKFTAPFFSRATSLPPLAGEEADDADAANKKAKKKKPYQLKDFLRDQILDGV
jgi:hypothetical protein